MNSFPKVDHSITQYQLFNAMALQLKVPKMACCACVNTITKAVKTVDPNAAVQAEPKTKMVSVETKAPETAIKEANAQSARFANAAAGYRAA